MKTAGAYRSLGMWLASVSLALSGCATRHEMHVDAVSQPAGKEIASYHLQTKVPVDEMDSLRVKEATSVIRTALSGRGLYEENNPDKADVIVNVDFGVEAPRVRMEISSVPVYAQTGGGVHYEETTVRDAKGAPSTRVVPVYDPPKTEMVGYRDIMVPVNTYEKYLRISAHENKPTVEGRPPTEIWSVSVKSEDESKDLRKYLPLLASASIDYIGKETKTEKVVKVGEEDPGVGFVKKGF